MKRPHRGSAHPILSLTRSGNRIRMTRKGLWWALTLLPIGQASAFMQVKWAKAKAGKGDLRFVE